MADTIPVPLKPPDSTWLLLNQIEHNLSGFSINVSSNYYLHRALNDHRPILTVAVRDGLL